MKTFRPSVRNANALLISVKSGAPCRRWADRAIPELGPAAFGVSLRPDEPGTAPPRLRRAYFECRYGQLHVHNAIPAGGGFDELTTLICLHASSSTGRVFLELSRILGASRSIYSPDTPGCGESDAPPGQLVDQRLRRRHRRFPRLHALPPGGLVRRAFRRRGGRRAGDRAAEGGAPRRSWWARPRWMPTSGAATATCRRPKARRAARCGRAPRSSTGTRDQRLPLLKQPLLVLRPRDNFWEAGGRVARLVPGARVVDLPDHDRHLLEKAPELVAKQVSAFLRLRLARRPAAARHRANRAPRTAP